MRMRRQLHGERCGADPPVISQPVRRAVPGKRCVAGSGHACLSGGGSGVGVGGDGLWQAAADVVELFRCRADASFVAAWRWVGVLLRLRSYLIFGVFCGRGIYKPLNHRATAFVPRKELRKESLSASASLLLPPPRFRDAAALLRLVVLS
jgi:hypothetical protein